ANAMLTSRSTREINKCFLDDAIHAAFKIARPHHGAAAALDRLLFHVYRRSDLLRPRRKSGDLAGNGRCPLVAGLLALALHHSDWLRTVETWMPTGVRSLPQ